MLEYAAGFGAGELYRVVPSIGDTVHITPSQGGASAYLNLSAAPGRPHNWVAAASVLLAEGRSGGYRCRSGPPPAVRV